MTARASFATDCSPLFSNIDGDTVLARPRTILVDSAQLESGEGMKKEFKDAASAEIDAYKADYRRRNPGADVDGLTDEDLLREVMNTVGKKGQLGADVRCVVSVAMLTEGWDANTVTHILGIRAFRSQLLCEQVVGRGLRRRSYAVNDEGRFDAEYANVYGVPFAFIPTDKPAAHHQATPAGHPGPVDDGPRAPADRVPPPRGLPLRGPRRAALPARRARAVRHRQGHRGADLDRGRPGGRRGRADRGRPRDTAHPSGRVPPGPRGSCATTSPTATTSTTAWPRPSPVPGSSRP